MSAADMPPQKPPTHASLERSVSPNGAEGSPSRDALTASQVIDLARKVKEAIREDARQAVEAGERALEGSTPPDGAVIVLRSDSRVVRRLRELRDGFR